MSALSAVMFTVALASSAQAYSYNQYDVADFTVTQTSTSAGATNDITASFTIPSGLTTGLSTSGYCSLSTPYLYSYKNGTYTSDYVNIGSATAASTQLTKSYLGTNYASFYPKSTLAAGSAVSITFTGAKNPSSLKGTGTYSIYCYENNSSTSSYNYFSGYASQVYGDAEVTVTMYQSNGTTAVKNVYVGLSYYNSSNWSDYEYNYGYTNASGQVKFAGLTNGRKYSLTYYYNDPNNLLDDDVPASTTLTRSSDGTAQSVSYNFIAPNAITYFYDPDSKPITKAYWYCYKTGSTNYVTDYVWRWGYTGTIDGKIACAANLDGSYELYAQYGNNYYSEKFTVSGGVVSGLDNPFRVPSPEIKGTVYAGTSVASGVSLYVHNKDWTVYRTVTTDANGKFEVALGTTDTFKIEMSQYSLPTGYYPVKPFSVDVKANTAGSALTLNLQKATKTISGTVLLQASSAAGIKAGTAVKDANIYGYTMDGYYVSTSTDSNGNFSFLTVGGSWNLYIYQKTWPATWAYAGESVVVNFNEDSTTETASVNFPVLPYDAHIKMRVLYPNGSTVSQSSVYCYAYGGQNNRIYSYAYADSSGICDLKTTAGPFEIYLYFYGSSGTASYTAPKIEPVTVDAGATKDLGDVYLVEKNAQIEGTISIRDTGKGVPSHYVYGYTQNGRWDWASAQTDTSGFYSLKVSAGEWTVNTYTNGIKTASGENVIYTGSGLAVNVAANEKVTGQDFIFDVADAALSFKIVKEDGKELTDEYGWASVHQVDTTSSYGWNNTGCYVQRGSCTLNISSSQSYQVDYYSYRNWYWHENDDKDHKDYSYSHITVEGVQTDKVSVSKDKTQEVLVVMTENNSELNGEFIDQDGKSANIKGYVYASSENKQWVSTYLDGESNYTLKVPAGTWRLSYWTNTGWTTTQNESQKVTVAAGEKATVNFTVLNTNAKISGTILDPDGKPVTSPTFVQASTVYGKEETETGEKYGLVQKTTYTDDKGIFSMDVPSGTYFVTTSSPDYLSAQPIEVTADTQGSAANLELSFINPGVAISGKVYDGVGISVNVHRLQAVGDAVAGAFVYGYCAGGSYMTTTTDTSGNYVLNVPAADTCFVGATYQVGQTAYYSSQTEIKVKKDAVTQDITLNKTLTLPATQTVEFKPTEAMVITLEDGTTVECPANAITADTAITKVTIVITPVMNVVHQPGFEPLSIAYEFKATDQNGNPITQFASDVKITLKYKESEATATGATEDDLQLGYYEDGAGAWQHVDGGTIKNKDKDKIEVSVDHFSSYAVLSSRSVITSVDTGDDEGDDEEGDDNGNGGDDGSESGENTVEQGILSAPKKVTVRRRSAHSVEVKWSNVGSAVAYNVQVTLGKNDKVAARATTKKRSVVIKKLKAGQVYKLTVRSVGATGSKSGWSKVVSVRTKTSDSKK